MAISTGRPVLFNAYIVAFNVLYSLISIAIIIYASYCLLNFHPLHRNGQTFVNGPIIASVLVAIVALQTALFGCCSVHCVSSLTLSSYAILLMILLVSKIAIGAMLLGIRDPLLLEINAVLSESWNHRDNETAPFWTNTQSQYNCCGLNAPSDYGKSVDQLQLQLHVSCCSAEPHPSVCTEDTAHSDGCSPVLKRVAERSADVLAFLTIFAAGFELLGIVLTQILAHSERKRARKSDLTMLLN